MTTLPTFPATAAATPRPWSFEDNGETTIIRDDDDGGAIAQLKWLKGPHGLGGRRTNEEVLANGALIVAAVNAYDGLRAELAAVTAERDALLDHIHNLLTDISIERSDQAQAALALYERHPEWLQCKETCTCGEQAECDECADRDAIMNRIYALAGGKEGE